MEYFQFSQEEALEALGVDLVMGTADRMGFLG